MKPDGFKVHAKKSSFARNELEYLGFKKIRQRIIPLSNKVEAIKNIAVPANKKYLQAFN